MEYRPVPESRLQEFENVAHYAFYPEDEPVDSDRVGDPSSQFGDRRALFAGEEMVAVCRLLEFEARCRDDWITLGGFRAVATPPEHRREGHAATLMAEGIAEFAERDAPLVALWPFDHGFYADLGWAAAAKRSTYRLPPAALAPIAENDTGRLFRPSAEEWDRLQAVNVAASEGTSLSIRRTERWWRHRVFEQSGTKRHVYAWERDGEVESYVVYTVEREDGDRVLYVQDMASVDDRAFRHVCWILANHDSQIETVEMTEKRGSELGDLLDRVASPKSVSCELSHGAMVRIADVPTALESLTYPEDLTATVTLDVVDELAGWNDETFEIRFEHGRVQCNRVEGGNGDTNPDVTVDVGTLSQLVVGYCDVDRAARVGTLTIHREETRGVFERAFPPRPVELAEFF